MTGSFFVDTGVLVYAYDRSEPVKQALAVELMNDLVASRAAVISTQVLSEFFNAITRRIAVPLTVNQAHEQREKYPDGMAGRGRDRVDGAGSHARCL